MNNDQLLARLDSLDSRMQNMENNQVQYIRELGVLSGKIKGSSMVPLIVKFVVFPLIVVLGGLAGINLLWV